MEKIKVIVVSEDDDYNALPKYATDGSSAVDLTSIEDVAVSSGEIKLVRTGIKVAIPIGYEIQIRPRSGLALKNGITVLNTPGTIDSDYRGEVGIVLINHSPMIFMIEKGDRIAQAVLSKVERIEWLLSTRLPETGRGEGGFGSTGRQDTEIT